KPGKIYAATTGFSDYAEVNRSLVESLRSTEQDFYERKAPFKFDAAAVKRVEVDAPEIKAGFEKKGDAWAIADAGLQKEADGAKLNDLVEKLSRMEAFRIFSDK